MTRRSFVWYGVLGALFIVSLWRLTTSVLPIHSEWWTPTILPTLLAASGLGLFIYGWHSAVPGILPKAGALLGLSAALLIRISEPGQVAWLPVLGLAPALAGIGMLIEINRGHGWQFSRRQGIGLILFGGVLALAFLLLASPGGQPVGSVAQLNLFPGWSDFSGVLTEIGLYIERIVR